MIMAQLIKHQVITLIQLTILLKVALDYQNTNAWFLVKLAFQEPNIQDGSTKDLSNNCLGTMIVQPGKISELQEMFLSLVTDI